MQWNSKLTTTLLNLDCTQSKSDYSLFTKHYNNHLTVVIVCIDDWMIVGNIMIENFHLKNVLYTEFNIKDLRNVKYFLGFKVAKSSNAICQSTQNIDHLQEAGILGEKPVSNLMNPNKKTPP